MDELIIPEFDMLLEGIRPSGRQWGRDETKAFRIYYPKFRAAGAVPRLAEKWGDLFPPGRTYKAMRHKAHVMGLAATKVVDEVPYGY